MSSFNVVSQVKLIPCAMCGKADCFIRYNSKDEKGRTIFVCYGCYTDEHQIVSN